MGAARTGARDWLVALGVAAALLVSGLSGQRSGTASVPVGAVLLVAGGLALVAVRRYPVGVLVATAACAVGYQAAGFDVFAVAYLVAVFGAVRAGRRTATAVTSVLLLVALPGAAMVAGLRDPGEALTRARGVLELAWLLAAAAAGEALRQAERRADEAERTREESALRRAQEERLHIARELHDSLTHQISVVTLHAEAAVHLAGKRGEPVPEHLLAIREAGREASRELRAALGLLRDEDLRTACGLDQVADLVDRTRSGGLDASLRVVGDRRPVPPAVDRTAYRIVQESLTNITRHAGTASATVRVEYRPDAVVVQVDDDGAAAAAPLVPGGGLRGMHERVQELGGQLRAGARGDGGFRVHVELPTAQQP